MASTDKLIRIILQLDDQMSKAASNASGALRDLGGQMRNVGAIGTTAISAPIMAGFAAATNSAMEFESAFTGVRKTVDASEAEYAQLRSELVGLATDTDNAVSAMENAPIELMKIAEAAGQLGVEKENIAEFTAVMGELAMSTDIVGEEGARSLAKFAAATDFDLSGVRDLGNVIVDLGNNFATTENSILSFSTRMAAVSQAGFKQDEIMAYGAVMDELGLTAELAGTNFIKAVDGMAVAAASLEGGAVPQIYAVADALDITIEELENLANTSGNAGDAYAAFNQVFNDAPVEKQREAIAALGLDVDETMAKVEEYGAAWIAIDQMGETENITKMFEDISAVTGVASDELKVYAETANMTVEQFASLSKHNPAEAMLEFAKGLDALPLAEQVAVLDSLGFKGAEAQRVLRTLAAGHENLAEALTMANTAMNDSNALTDEAIMRSETAQGAMNAFRNNLAAVGDVIGQQVLPHLKTFLVGLTQLLNDFLNLPAPTQALIIGLTALLAIIPPIILVLGQLVIAYTALTGSATAATAAQTANTAAQTANTAASAANAASTATAGAAAAGASTGFFALAAGAMAAVFPFVAAVAVIAGVVTAIALVVKAISLLIARLGGLEAIAAKITDVLNNLADTVTTKLNSAAEAVTKWLTEAVSKAGDFVKGIGSIIGQIGTIIINGIKAFGRKMFEFGAAIVTGLANGISNKIKAVVDAVRNMGEQALNSVRNFLGIASPSKKFMEVGEQMAEGMNMGFNAAAQFSNNVSQSLIPSQTQTFTPAMSGGSTNIVINSNGINNEKELARLVSKELGKQARRNGARGF